MRLVLSKRFKKNLRDFLIDHPQLKASVKEKLSILRANHRAPALRTHKLSGKLKDVFAASITHKHRIIFCIEKDALILLVIGSHSDVY